MVMGINNRSIDQEIENFIFSIQDIWGSKPLNSDTTQEIADKILAELNHRNGNGE